MEKFCDITLMMSFGDVRCNGKDVITDFLKFNFIIISLKKHNLANHVTSGHQNQRLTGTKPKFQHPE